jgi:hypothetical protein
MCGQIAAVKDVFAGQHSFIAGLETAAIRESPGVCRQPLLPGDRALACVRPHRHRCRRVARHRCSRSCVRYRPAVPTAFSARYARASPASTPPRHPGRQVCERRCRRSGEVCARVHGQQPDHLRPRLAAWRQSQSDRPRRTIVMRLSPGVSSPCHGGHASLFPARSATVAVSRPAITFCWLQHQIIGVAIAHTRPGLHDMLSDYHASRSPGEVLCWREDRMIAVHEAARRRQLTRGTRACRSSRNRQGRRASRAGHCASRRSAGRRRQPA